MSSNRMAHLSLVALLSTACSVESGAPLDDSEVDAEALAPKETVNVDLSANLGKASRRAMGFLCGVASHTPSDAKLAPLGITFARGDVGGPCPLSYGRLRSTGATFDRILS